MSALEMSLEQWLKWGGTEEGWRIACHLRWDEVRASAHWHGGATCAAVGCPNGVTADVPGRNA